MSTHNSTGSSQASSNGSGAQADDAGTRSPEQIQAEIEETREQLGETLDALHAKLDVKSRARDRVTDEQGSLKPVVPVAAGVAVALVVGVVVWRRRR